MLLKRSSLAFLIYLASVVDSSPLNVTLSAPGNASAVQTTQVTHRFIVNTSCLIFAESNELPQRSHYQFATLPHTPLHQRNMRHPLRRIRLDQRRCRSRHLHHEHHQAAIRQPLLRRGLRNRRRITLPVLGKRTQLQYDIAA